MSSNMLGLIIGAVVGFIVTAVVTMIWPRNKARLLRPIVAALAGVGVAYIIMISL